MSKSLRNISALRKMLDGTHKFQTKTTVSFSDVKTDTNDTKAVGEIWTDENGIEWEQRNGFRIQKGKLDSIRKQLSKSKMPANCPKCQQAMTKRLDAKFWALEKHCFDCQITYEHEMRINGTFDQYEKQRILNNAESWLTDAEAEAQELIKIIDSELTFSDTEGALEKWNVDINREEFIEKVKSDFEDFKTNFIETIKQQINTVDNGRTSI
jgi:ribosomal protein L37AE/L43A